MNRLRRASQRSARRHAAVLLAGAAVAILALAALSRAGDPPPAPPPPPAETAPLFEDATAAAGLAGVTGAVACFADLDGDGVPDAVVDRTKVFLNRSVNSPDRSVNSPDRPVNSTDTARGRRFVRSERAATLSAVPLGRADTIQVGDVNGDGHADIFIARMLDAADPRAVTGGARNELWLGDGEGGFAKLTRPGVDEHAEAAISSMFFDYDADGVLDLFVANSYVRYGASLEAAPSRLFRGRGDGTFEDATARAGLLLEPTTGTATSRRPTYGVAHTDWNDDGRQDILQLSYGRQWNRLWRNNGDGTFTDVAPGTSFDGDDDRDGRYPAEAKKLIKDLEDEAPFRSNGNTFDAAVADFDGDGHMDVFLAEITHWWAGPSSDLSMMLVNEGPERAFRFRRRPELIPPRPHAGTHWNQGDRHAGWLDVDNDGLLDLVVASSDYPDEQILRLYHQRPDHTFEEWTDRLGFHFQNASQISFGDFDRDGATDMLVATTDFRLSAEQKKTHSSSVALFRNLAAARAGNGFLSIRLRGLGKGHSNTDAVGARVTIFVEGKRQTREVYGGLGHAGHRDDQEVRFGVGKARRVDRVEVRWPDARSTVQTFEGVEASRFYSLEEGGSLRPTR